MRKGGDVSGVASQAARAKTEHVIHKVSDDHFDDLLGNPGGSGQTCHGAPPKDGPEKTLQIHDRLLYHTRLMSSCPTVVNA